MAESIKVKDKNKVLILSCNTGEGHNSCAKALKSTFVSEGFVCNIQDTFSLAGEGYSKAISQSYDFLARNDLVGTPYEIAEWYSELKHKPMSPVYQINKVYTRKLYSLIKDNGYDTVICTHIFPALAVSFLMEKHPLDIATFFVATDYTCYPFMDETNLDGYMIAHQDITEEYAHSGVPLEKIHATGIPCNERIFLNRVHVDEARRDLAERFNWKSGGLFGRWYLIMGGSMGFGNMDRLLSELLVVCEPEDRIICVCGRNERQKAHTDEQYGHSDIVRTIGYTDQIPLLMDACNVLFTKPGGLTSTEALLKNIPLIHTAPIRGVEDKNANFFSERGMSYCASDPRRQAEYARLLCDSRAVRESMLAAQRNNRTIDSFRRVLAIVTGS
jgi:processive 1,2-diacylglycerol beta-glucosyltransferase